MSTQTLSVSASRWKSDLKIAAVLGVLAALAAAALMPYMLQLMPQKFAHLPVPLWVVVVQSAVETLVLIGLMALAGLRMGHQVGLGAPLLQHWINRQALPMMPLRPLHALLLSLVAMLVVLGLGAVLDPLLPPMLHAPAHTAAGPSALNGFLASFYGGISEELQLRLFLMTLLVWLIARLHKSAPSPQAYWTAIILAALLFGAGHLPTAHQVWGLSAIVVLRTVLLNAILGLAFGWLYWKRGLEMAILAHFGSDIVLHVFAPLLAHGA